MERVHKRVSCTIEYVRLEETVATLPGDLGLIPIAEALK